ncbi:MAG: site-specific integrase [Muribaculaceae bacterium]|nr:site-specific integrase [Muribaculaceae bacterium]
MATLNAVIVPAKVLKGGRHKIRISVAHNGETRYIVTDVTVDSEKEFRNGTVVKRPDAAILNTKIRGLLQRYQGVIDELEYTNGLTCPELVFQIKNAGNYKHRTLFSIYEEYIANANITPGTLVGYKNIWRIVSQYINEQTLVENITHGTILGLEKFMRDRGLRSTTVRNYLVFVRVLINYAKRCGYVQFRVDPFANYELPNMEVRQSWLTVDEVKRIRDLPLKKWTHTKCRDLFMLSYYLGGINITDLLDINFNEQADVIHYIRKKTKRRPKMNKYVEFEIPDEAKTIIAHYKGPDGRIKVSPNQRKEKLHSFFNAQMRTLSRLTGIKHLIYYAARKSFSQHAFLLGVSTSVIDFVLGHRVDKGSTSLYSYISVTPEMATKAVRQVLDNLK